MTMKYLGTACIALLLLRAVRGSSHQCEYQGKTYSEGEDLPTHRLCLACKCTPDFVEPNDRVCTIIDCPVGNVGCIPVYNDTECCPVSYNCERSEASAKCVERYFMHYRVKGCTPDFEEGSECPKKFNCPKEFKVDDEACEFDGQLYEIGEGIDTGNPCQICSCQRGWEGIEIGCINVDCPPLNNSCREVYEPGKCCAVRVECNAEEDKQKPEKTCEYGGKTYHLGEKIYPEEDPCLICRCNEHWTGINEDSCQMHYCALESKRKKLAQGCLPIYHEATCCPIEFYCGQCPFIVCGSHCRKTIGPDGCPTCVCGTLCTPPKCDIGCHLEYDRAAGPCPFCVCLDPAIAGLPDEGLRNRSAPLLSDQDLESGNFCEFKGNRYKVGDVLDYKHPTNCVTCTCLTPPDFTCVYRKCPPPPNDDYEICKPIYIPGECCPTYDCKRRLAGKCPFIVCGPHCQKTTGPDGCPTCVCGPLCSPPKCDIGCHLEYDRAAGPCPFCVCLDPAIAGPSAVQCSQPKCDPGCIINYASKPCPSCACPGTGVVQCSMPKCDPGCTIDRNVKPCPVCKCKGRPPALQCSPVKCESHCQEEQGSDGCPICRCPLCTPPICGPGCILNPNSKPCPTCICDRFQSRYSLQQSVFSDPFCSNLKCGPGCQRAFTPFSPSKRCPMCICSGRLGEHLTCAAMQCELPCQFERFTEHGCPTCICNPIPCPQLDCAPGLALQKSEWVRCPRCRPIQPEDDNTDPGLRDSGCPDDSLCQKSCKNRGHKSGKCRGNTCECH